MLYNKRVEVVRVTGVEDDLTTFTDALYSLLALVTPLHVLLQTAPLLSVVQHEDQLDVIHGPDES